MKRIYFALFLLTANISFGQWALKKSGTEQALLSVFFINENKGFIAGDAGTLLKTTDGGNSWMPVNSNTKKKLRCVFFPDSITGYIAGESATLLKTTDGGSTWTPIVVTTKGGLQSIFFLDANTGFIVSYYAELFKTTDGGATWEQLKNPSYNNASVNSVYFFSPNEGYALMGEATVYKTANGGKNWDYFGGNMAYSSSLCFPDRDHAFISCMDGAILAMPSDKSEKWERLTTGTKENLFDIHFTNAKKGCAVGRSGTAILTNDGGKTWIRQKLPPTADGNLSAVRFINANTCIIVGYGGIILKTAWTSTQKKTSPKK